MKERTLLKLALTVSLLGLGILLYMAQSLPIESLERSFTGNVEGTRAKVMGTVESVRPAERVTFLTVSEENSLEVVAFGAVNGLAPGDLIEIIGHVDSSSEEFIADRIRVVEKG